MTGPSAHLSWAELACHDGTPYPAAWRTTRAVDLAVVFEAVRAVFQLPLLVCSAYRTPAWNRRVGGAARSQHVEGRALDVAPVRGVTLEELWRAALGLAQTKTTPLRGLGRYTTFLHLDVRPSPRLVVWDARNPRGWDA